MKCKQLPANPNSTICSGCVSDRPTWKSSFDELRKDASRRDRLIKERGHRCEVCGNVEWNNLPIPLELDHIDGDCTNNLKDNLRLICPNCHAQTPTYKGRNIGRPGATPRSERLKHYGSYRTKT